MFAPAYLDYNASTPMAPEVREAMLPWLGLRWGNASSRHEYGRQARAALDAARAQVAHAVGAHASEVVFTSGGSESNNLFLKGVAATMRPGVLAIGATEHPCVREPARQLGRAGWQVREIRVDAEGQIDQEQAARLFAEESPTIASMMLANNETGVIHDLPALSALAQQTRTLLHTDAVQALGKIALDFRALGVHALSLSAHKIGGPTGVGALVLSKRLELQPLIAGGGQERGLRSGTENLAGIVGFGVAAALARERQASEATRLRALRNELEDGLQACGAQLFAAAAERLPNTVYFAFPNLDGETLVGKLDRAGFACASGAACSSANPEPSRTLLAMGVAAELARGAVRVSLGTASEQVQLQRFLGVLRQTVQELDALPAMAAALAVE